jgi:UDP-N-acetylglucosamine 2-epimerase (non-hydrolysing)
MEKKKIAVVFGTRPDTIKMAPIIKELERNSEFFELVNIATAQHRDMLDQVLDAFSITPHYDMNIMEPRQTLAGLTAKVIKGLDTIFEKEKPDMVLVQGDTSTTFVGSLAAFYRQISVGHIEAGLRTNDKSNPFPEEINRRLTSCISDLHFAPTLTAKKALLREAYPDDDIYITGNTVVDALQYTVKENYHFSVEKLNEIVASGRKIILVTMHRRENWGKPMEGACSAIKRMALKYPDFQIVFPMHLNPVVRDVVAPALSNIPNVSLIEPLEYNDFVNLMANAYLILTDSGGVQEEGPHFGIPILVLRLVTERPEAVDYGTVKLVGLDEETIFSNATLLLDNKEEYQKMANAVNPYGDGKAAKRTIDIIKKFYGFPHDAIEDFKPSVK